MVLGREQSRALRVCAHKSVWTDSTRTNMTSASSQCAMANARAQNVLPIPLCLSTTLVLGQQPILFECVERPDLRLDDSKEPAAKVNIPEPPLSSLGSAWVRWTRPKEFGRLTHLFDPSTVRLESITEPMTIVDHSHELRQSGRAQLPARGHMQVSTSARQPLGTTSAHWCQDTQRRGLAGIARRPAARRQNMAGEGCGERT